MAAGDLPRPDTELRRAVIERWRRLVRDLPPGAGQLAELARRTGTPAADLAMADSVRQQLADPDRPVSLRRLHQALHVITQAERGLRSASRTAPRTAPARRLPPRGPRRPVRRPPQLEVGAKTVRWRGLTPGQRSNPVKVRLRNLGDGELRATADSTEPWLRAMVDGYHVVIIARPPGPGVHRGQVYVESAGGAATIAVRAEAAEAAAPRRLRRRRSPTSGTGTGGLVFLIMLALGLMALLVVAAVL